MVLKYYQAVMINRTKQNSQKGILAYVNADIGLYLLDDQTFGVNFIRQKTF